MSRYVERFGADYPGVDVRIDYMHPTRVIESVLAGEVDLGLISFPAKWPDLVATPWRTEEMVLAVHPSHRLAALDVVDVEALDGETFVGFDGGLPIRREVDRFLRKHGVHVRVVLEFDNIETIKRAVEVPLGSLNLAGADAGRRGERGELAGRSGSLATSRPAPWRSSTAEATRCHWRRPGSSTS